MSYSSKELEHVTLMVDGCNNDKECVMKDITRQVSKATYDKEYDICLIIETDKKVDGEGVFIFTCLDKTTEEIKNIIKRNANI